MFCSDINTAVPYPNDMPMEMRRYWDAPAWQNNSVTRFNVLDQIGEGAYSEVHKAKDSINGSIVALKQLKRMPDGFPQTALREIQYLQKLRHENIVQLYGVVSGNTLHSANGMNAFKFPQYQHIRCPELGDTFLVFEHCATDMDVLNSGIYPVCHVQAKYFIRQLISVLAYMQHCGVLHRDIKPSNLLLTHTGQVKLADFNLAKKADRDMTVEVVTRYYRAPEVLLLGSREVYAAEKAKGPVHGIDYSTKIDIWAAGVMQAELLTKQRVLLKGASDIDQYQCIINLCGEPTEQSFPGVGTFALMKQIAAKRAQLGVHMEPAKSRLTKVLREHNVPADAIDLLERILVINPHDRIDAQQALNHPYFADTILPHQWTEQFGQMFSVWLADKKIVPTQHNIDKRMNKMKTQQVEAITSTETIIEHQVKKRRLDIPVKEIPRAPPQPKEEETLDYGF